VSKRSPFDSGNEQHPRRLSPRWLLVGFRGRLTGVGVDSLEGQSLIVRRRDRRRQSPRRHPLKECWLPCQSLESLSQCHWITDRNEQPVGTIFNDIFRTPAARGHDGYATHKGLAHEKRRRLELRRQNQDVVLGEDLVETVRRERWMHRHRQVEDGRDRKSV